jgi:hypothetical protein
LKPRPSSDFRVAATNSLFRGSINRDVYVLILG